jgi:hypothetical protein
MLDPKSAAEPSPVERRLSVNRALRRATLPEKDEHGASATVVQLREPAATFRRLRNESLPPRRRPNSAVRSREYLTSDEVEKMMEAARSIGRHGHRDATGS